MKLFTLISGKVLHLTAKNGVIPADAAVALLNAKELNDLVATEALDYRKQVHHECELLKEQAQQDGFSAGLQQWSEQLQQLQKDFETVCQQVEQATLHVALTASKKILGRELELHPEAIADIIATNLKTVSQHRKVMIYVNHLDLKHLSEQREKLKQVFDRLESLSLKEREDVQPGGFVIETEGGIINLSTVEKQWKPIEVMFESFAQQKSQP